MLEVNSDSLACDYKMLKPQNRRCFLRKCFKQYIVVKMSIIYSEHYNFHNISFGKMSKEADKKF